MEEHTGCGYSIFGKNSNEEIDNLSVYLGERISVFQAELEAISRVAQDLWSIAGPSDKITILTDSQSALQALAQDRHNSKTRIKCITAINNLSNKADITIRWVKAHVGIPGNELADAHAKAGITNRANLPNEQIPQSISSFKAELNEKLTQKWNRIWFAKKGCRQTKNFYPEVDIAKSKKLLKLSRPTLSRIIRITTGHNFMSRHTTLIANKAPPLCRYCEMDCEDSEHIVAVCEALWKIRSDIFQHPQLDTPIPWEVEQMTKFINHSKIIDLEQNEHPQVRLDAVDATATNVQ
jgi:ribonuclease HI